MSDNFNRMVRLAEEFFAVKNDPDQLDVDEEVLSRLTALHPATVSEEVEGDGPVVWVLLIPSTLESMHRFLRKEITEKDLLDAAHPGDGFDALYLCSALVLPEFRNRGRAERITLQAIAQLQKDFPLKALFVWPFSKEGDRLSQRIAQRLALPLYERKD
jgi:ribosomal protein S18 acetylase RimI-like enzyme